MKYLFSLLFFQLITCALWAQPLPPNPAPLDSGLGILLTSGLIIAYRKYRSER